MISSPARGVALAMFMLTASMTAGFAQAAGPAAALVLSPAAVGGSTVVQGWPLVVELTLWREAAPEAVAPLEIAARAGAWRDAIVVTVEDDAGTAVPWPLHRVAQEEAKLTLDAGGAATVEWWLTPEETRALPAGLYTLTVAFDPTRVTGLPEGEAPPRAESCLLRVMAEPELTGELAATKLYLQAWYHLVRGDQAAAETALAALLAADANSIGARRLQAIMAARAGKRDEALKHANEAIRLYLSKHPKACPPVGLLSLCEQLRGAEAEVEPEP